MKTKTLIEGRRRSAAFEIPYRRGGAARSINNFKDKEAVMADIPNSFDAKRASLKFTALLHMAAVIFTIIGALNWGLIGLCGFDSVAYVFGPMSRIARAVYTAVGLSGVYSLLVIKRFI